MQGRRQARSRWSTSRSRLTSRLASVRGSSAPPSRSPSPLAFTATSTPLSQTSVQSSGTSAPLSHTSVQPSGTGAESNDSGFNSTSVPGDFNTSQHATLERVLEECKAVNRKFDRFNTRLQTVEDKTNKVLSSLKELSEMTKKYYKSAFKIKGSQYEVQPIVVYCT